MDTRSCVWIKCLICRPMHKWLLFLLVLAAWVPANAQYPGYSPVANLGAFRQQFAAASQKTTSIKSDFIQEKNLSMLSEKIISHGKFWFKRDNLVRMEYLQPFQFLMILHKNNVYIKDGAKENRISTGSSRLFQQINRITVDCVQGTALDNPDFSIRVFENGPSYLVELSPKSKGLREYFSHILLVVDKKDYSVLKIEMQELSGDYTMIRFLNKELNVNIPDAVFAIN